MVKHPSLVLFITWTLTDGVNMNEGRRNGAACTVFEGKIVVSVGYNKNVLGQ